MNKLIIHASNIHEGGGKTLLLPLLKSAKDLVPVIVFLDKRLYISNDLSNNLNKVYVNSTLLGRFFVEYKLYKLAKKNDIVLCFGNLPPIFRLKSKVVLYVQNRYLVSNEPLNSLFMKMRIRVLLERFWLSMCNKNANRIIVQSDSMKRLVLRTLKRKADVIPFFDVSSDENEKNIEANDHQKKYDFIYVASGEPQKNHFNLIEAWKILAKEGIFPSLCLTLSNRKYSSLAKFIKDSCANYDLKIENVAEKKQEELKLLYKNSNALIYPSTLESFGLPLIEAKLADLPIIASELDYVRDVVDPVETFDPTSAVSISRAVKRFIKINEKHNPIISSEKFLMDLIQTLKK